MQLPNDEQMLNAMRRIHVEGYMGELRRPGGVFEAPDPSASQIADPRDERGVPWPHCIDDKSLSVWTGRYVRHFANNPTAPGGPHEFAVRAVLLDLHNSDEARQKRGDTTPPAPTPGVLRGPISVSGRDFEVPS